jgi:hypothetical protein
MGIYEKIEIRNSFRFVSFRSFSRILHIIYKHIANKILKDYLEQDSFNYTFHIIKLKQNVYMIYIYN